MAVYALGDRVPQVDSTAYVHPLAVVIGDVVLGPESSVWPPAVIRADDNRIAIGARTSVQDNAVLHCTGELATIVATTSPSATYATSRGAPSRTGRWSA